MGNVGHLLCAEWTWLIHEISDGGEKKKDYFHVFHMKSSCNKKRLAEPSQYLLAALGLHFIQ